MIDISDITDIMKITKDLTEDECDKYIMDIRERIDVLKEQINLLEDVIDSLNRVKELRIMQRENEYRLFHSGHREREAKMELQKSDDRFKELKEQEKALIWSIENSLKK